MKSEILIIEDDPIISESITKDLEKNGYKVAAQCDNGNSSIKVIDKELPDLILMDIKLKGDMSGIHIAKYVQRNYQIPIIYLTDSIDNNTFKEAKSTSPINYLTKPFQTHQLLMAIELALDRGFRGENSEFGFFRSGDKEEVKVFYRDILFLKSDGVYCNIVLKDKKFTISQPMGTVHKRIPYRHIIRVAKSYCVNKKHIDKIRGHTVYIKDEQIVVGEKYRPLLKEFNFIK